MNLEQIYSQVILEKINAAPAPVQRHMEAFKMHLQTKNNILFLTTSNRWEGHADDKPKSTLLAYHLRNELADKNIKLIKCPCSPYIVVRVMCLLGLAIIVVPKMLH